MDSEDSFRDDPIDGTPESDRLNRVDFASTIVKVLERIRSQGKSSSVIGLIGDWGSGKSSLVAMIRNQLDTTPNGWVVAQFNPWAFSDEQSAVAGFFREVRAVMPKWRKWHNPRKAIGNLSVAISPLFSLTSLVAIDTSGAVKGFGKLILGRDSQSQIMTKAEKALERLHQPILMIIDDLDRLNPEELLLVFKLVRLVGRLPNVYYLLVYDERTLIDVLTSTPLARENESRAHDYLEKLIQVRVDLPALGENQIRKMTNNLLEETLIVCSVMLNQEEEMRLEASYDGTLSKKFVTPRSIRRFFGQMSAFFPTIREEVNFVDFLQISWIRVFYPRLYIFLQSSKPELTNQNARLARGDDDYSIVKEKWISRLRFSGVDEGEIASLLKLLGEMFLPISAAISHVEYGVVDIKEAAERQGIGHGDYFDRYFMFGVPDDDIADEVVLQAISAQEASHDSDAIKRLQHHLIHDTERAIRKLTMLLPRRTSAAKAILELLSAGYGNLPGDTSIFFNPSRMFVDLGKSASLILDDSTLTALLEQLCVALPSLDFMANIIANVKIDCDEDDADAPTWLALAENIIAGKIETEMLSYESVPLGDWENRRFDLIWPWRAINVSAATQWFRRQSRNWGILQTLMKLVPSATQYTDKGPVKTLGQFDSVLNEQLVGLDDAISELSDELETVAEEVSRFSTLDTESNRRMIVLNSLRKIRDARSMRAKLAETLSLEITTEDPPED